MEVGSPEWIEASLARLDELEVKKDEHETALESISDPITLKEHKDAVARLDEEIKTLYAQLESVADDGEADAGADAGDAPQATQADDELSSPHAAAPEPSVEPAPAPEPAPAAAPIAAAVDNPFGSPADSPFGSPSPSPSPGGFDSPAPVSFDDGDLKPKGGGAKWAFLVIVIVAAAGVGGYFVWADMQAKKAAEAKKTPGDQPAQVIKAAEVPDDTEAPPTVPSGKATISPNATSNTSKKKKKKNKGDEDKAKPLELKGGDGPL